MGSEGKTALLIIDVQNDFLPGGSLAVKEGPVKVVPVINELLGSKEKVFDYVLASQDWHPKVSFPSMAGRWGLLSHRLDIIISTFLVSM
jgi:nicotinamidase-related amidase